MKITPERLRKIIKEELEAAMNILERENDSEDGSPIKYPDGKISWFRNGVLHRKGGLPAVEDPDGTKEWWVNGKRHRTDGPAVEDPAIGTEEWYLHGKKLSQQEFEDEVKKLNAEET
jgi:hypothetical protein